MKHTKCEKTCFLYSYISRNLSYISRCIVKLPHIRQQLNCASLYVVVEDRPNIGENKIFLHIAGYVRNSCAVLSGKDSNLSELSSGSFHVFNRQRMHTIRNIHHFNIGPSNSPACKFANSFPFIKRGVRSTKMR